MAIFPHQEKHLDPFRSDSAKFFLWPSSLFIAYAFFFWGSDSNGNIKANASWGYPIHFWA